MKPKKTNLPSLPEVPIAVAPAFTHSKTYVSDNFSSVAPACTHSQTYVSDNSSSVAPACTHSQTYVSDNSSSVAPACTHSQTYVSDNSSSVAPASMHSQTYVSDNSSSVAPAFAPASMHSQTYISDNSSSVASCSTHSKTYISNNCPSVMHEKSLSSKSKRLDIAVLSSNNKEINHEIHQILRLVESLKVSMNGLTSLIREIIQRLDVLEKNNESLKVQSVLDECNTLGVFPIATAASLKEVESIIENNSAFKKNLITSLTQVTSADIKKTIRNILHYLITDEMAQQYSWLGQRHKAAFQNLQTSKILTLVVKMRHKDITCEQISSVAAEWLKHAKQRTQRKSEKEKKCRKEKTPQLSSSSDDSENDELSNDECSNYEHQTLL